MLETPRCSERFRVLWKDTLSLLLFLGLRRQLLWHSATCWMTDVKPFVQVQNCHHTGSFLWGRRTVYFFCCLEGCLLQDKCVFYAFLSIYTGYQSPHLYFSDLKGRRGGRVERRCDSYLNIAPPARSCGSGVVPGWTPPGSLIRLSTPAEATKLPSIN